MKNIAITAFVAATLMATALPAAANDFSLGYDVDRFPATKLSLPSCRAAVARGAAAVGYSTRVDQDQKTLALHVSAPRGDGRSLISYCITAGNQTVFVIQALDYTGPGKPEVDRVKARVAAEVRKAAGAR